MDLSNGFYRVDLNTDDVLKLGVVLPTNPGINPMSALNLVFPMGRKNSLPTFSTATETISDLANLRLSRLNYQPPQNTASTGCPWK